MNITLRRTLLALAVVGAFSASMAYAGGRDDNQHDRSSRTSSSHVEINKDINLDSDIRFDGNDIDLEGTLHVNSAAVALSEGSQKAEHNLILNDEETVNNATLKGDIQNRASGNLVAANAAGNGNQQGSNVAISSDGATESRSPEDSSFTFNCGKNGCGHGGGNQGGGSDQISGEIADAEAIGTQSVKGQFVTNKGRTNNAQISSHADIANGASGNIVVMNAAGDSNEQLSQLSAATTSGNVYALATSTLDQDWSGNIVMNGAYCYQNTSNNAVVDGNVQNGASGNVVFMNAAGQGNQQAANLSMAVGASFGK